MLNVQTFFEGCDVALTIDLPQVYISSEKKWEGERESRLSGRLITDDEIDLGYQADLLQMTK